MWEGEEREGGEWEGVVLFGAVGEEVVVLMGGFE